MRWFSVLAATIGLALVACGSDDDETLPVSDTPSATSSAPTVTPHPSGDTLCVPDPSHDIIFTEAQKQSIISAAEADQRLRSLLGDVERTPLVAVSAWPFADGVTFVSVSFALAEPVPVDADLPRLDMGGRGGECTPSALPPPGYTVRQEHFQLDAGIISATIIYETGELVDIFPTPQINLSPP
jgi:ABC-type Fe3+-hydroxamate transport system substrate-binding protein